MGLSKDKLIYDGTTPSDGDSVAAFLHATNKLTSTAVDTKEALDVYVANSIEVTVSHENDSIKIGDGTDLMGVNEDGSINAVVSGAVTVSATDLDIRDLVDTQDSVRAKDCAEALLNTAKAVSTSGVLVAAALSGRRRILVQNQGSKAIFVGPSGVATGTGFKISGGASFEIPLGAGAALHAVAESGTQNCIVMELA